MIKITKSSLPSYFRIIAITAASCGVLFLLSLWLKSAFVSSEAVREQNKKTSPLVNEAKMLKITYESVMAYPYQTIGKPAIWCIRNTGDSNIFYEGDESKRISVTGDKMPLFHGDKHSPCTDMLVIIQGVKSYKLAQGSSFVEVSFIKSMSGKRENFF